MVLPFYSPRVRKMKPSVNNKMPDVAITSITPCVGVRLEALEACSLSMATYRYSVAPDLGRTVRTSTSRNEEALPNTEPLTCSLVPAWVASHWSGGA